jgi:hypothetical protein
MLFFIIANVGLSLLLAFGAYCILLKMVIPALPLLIDVYAVFFINTLLVIEIFHFVMSRTRTAIKFFPILSFMISFTSIFVCSLKRFAGILMILNLNFTLHIILFLTFILI